MADSSAQGPPSAPTIDNSDWDGNKKDALGYNAEFDTYRASFDSDSRSTTEAVISTVGVVSETKPLELPPLYSVIDPDALEGMVQPAVRGPSNGDSHVTFTYVDHTVTVHSYGIITVQPPQEDASE